MDTRLMNELRPQSPAKEEVTPHANSQIGELGSRSSSLGKAFALMTALANL